MKNFIAFIMVMFISSVSFAAQPGAIKHVMSDEKRQQIASNYPSEFPAGFDKEQMKLILDRSLLFSIVIKDGQIIGPFIRNFAIFESIKEGAYSKKPMMIKANIMMQDYFNKNLWIITDGKNNAAYADFYITHSSSDLVKNKDYYFIGTPHDVYKNEPSFNMAYAMTPEEMVQLLGYILHHPDEYPTELYIYEVL